MYETAYKSTDAYEIIDTKTGNREGKPYTGQNARRRASARADKLDMAYGAVRYFVRYVS